MAKKKINCKDGLNWQEELRARKIREKLKSRDSEVIRELNVMYLKWCTNPNTSFLEWLELEGKRVWYSALKRIGNWHEYI